METQITVVTLDRLTEIVISYFPCYFRFTIKPYGTRPDISNTRHYAFGDEAILALELKGYEYADQLIQEAMSRLPKLVLAQQNL